MGKKSRLGRLRARYLFALNSDRQARFSRCPKCQRLTNLRKFPLLIHVEGFGLLVLGKTCRYCPRCEFIIAHQDELEAELVRLFEERKPAVVGNDYLVLGTVERKAWKQGLTAPAAIDDLLTHTADFKKYMNVWVEPGGWRLPDDDHEEASG